MIVGNHARGARRSIQPFEKIHSKNNGRKPRVEQRLFLPFPETAEAQNWARDAVRPELNAFFGHRHAEPFGSGEFERLRAFDRTVAVTVGFYGRHNSDVRTQAFPCCTKIMNEVREIDLRPGRAAGAKDGGSKIEMKRAGSIGGLSNNNLIVQSAGIAID